MSNKTIIAGVFFGLCCAAAGWAQGDAKSIFLDKCAVCHGEDGHGKTAKGRKVKVKDITATIKTDSEADMVKIVTEGKGKDMDGFAKDYSAAQIKGLVEYYRSLGK